MRASCFKKTDGVSVLWIKIRTCCKTKILSDCNDLTSIPYHTLCAVNVAESAIFT